MPSAITLDIPKLRQFVALCEAGSITQAARRLNIAQPALSMALSKLEAQLGITLFEREARGITMTRAGQKLLARAYQILELTATAELELQHSHDEVKGEVAIGLPSSTTAVLAIPLIERLSREHPGIRLRVVESFSGYIWDWLSSGRLDLAVVFDKARSREIRATPFARETMHLISKRSPRMRLASDALGWQDVARLPLIMPARGHSFRDTIERRARQAGADLDIRLEIDAGQHLVKLIERGELHSILAPCAVAEQLAKGSLSARAIAPALSRTVCLAQRKVPNDPIAVHTAAQALLAEAQALIQSGTWAATLLEVD